MTAKKDATGTAPVVESAGKTELTDVDADNVTAADVDAHLSKPVPKPKVATPAPVEHFGDEIQQPLQPEDLRGPDGELVEVIETYGVGEDPASDKPEPIGTDLPPAGEEGLEYALMNAGVLEPGTAKIGGKNRECVREQNGNIRLLGHAGSNGEDYPVLTSEEADSFRVRTTPDGTAYEAGVTTQR